MKFKNYSKYVLLVSLLFIGIVPQISAQQQRTWPLYVILRQYMNMTPPEIKEYAGVICGATYVYFTEKLGISRDPLYTESEYERVMAFIERLKSNAETVDFLYKDKDITPAELLTIFVIQYQLDFMMTASCTNFLIRGLF